MSDSKIIKISLLFGLIFITSFVSSVDVFDQSKKIDPEVNFEKL